MSDQDPSLATTEPPKRTGVFVRGRPSARALSRRIERGQLPRTGKHAEGGHDLGVVKGLAALSLDALSSVAYGPEVMILVLVAAGTGAVDSVVPLTVVITVMLVLLVISYTQVIAAHPEGGGAYSWPRQISGHGRACSPPHLSWSTTCSRSPSACPRGRPASAACSRVSRTICCS